jgi:hypothetical protein
MRRTYHHERLVRLVLVLGRTLPLAFLPLLVEQEAEVFVREGDAVWSGNEKLGQN